MKILLTGASGYIGARIYKDLRQKDFDVWGTYYNNKIEGNSIKVDLTNRSDVYEVLDKLKPDVIIHLAADAHSQTCEDNPEYAKLINVESTRFLVDQAKFNDIRFIQLSTFACFNPSNVYGRTKLEAEQIVSELNNYIILRASLVVGVSPNTVSHNYFNSLLEAIRNNSPIEQDTSWEFEMTCINHLSNVIEAIIKQPNINKLIIPVIATGVTSRYKVAKDLLAKTKLEVKGINQNRVIPLPDFDRTILKANNLPEAIYEDCIEVISGEIFKQ